MALGLVRVRSSPARATPAPVAQRIEHRPPEPVAQVRVLPGALHVLGRVKDPQGYGSRTATRAFAGRAFDLLRPPLTSVLTGWLLLPSENVTQIIALVLILCCLAGGLFIPVSQCPHAYVTLAKFTPLYRLNELVHCPLVGGNFEWVWALNLAVWLAAFVVGAVWQFRRDTARV